jgi:hypothetical protein
MPEYDNTNSGVLFRNHDKQTDRHPDYRGSLNVEGKEYWFSGWIKESTGRGKLPAGTKFLSVAITAKDDPPSRPQEAGQDFDDDIPF